MDLFTLCDNIMYWLGDVTGLGYETACVLFNIYGEYTLVVLSTLLLIIPCKSIAKESKTFAIIGYILIILYIMFITWYVYMNAGHLLTLPIDEQFKVSVQDVLRRAKELGISYQRANLEIFVYEPMLVICFNIVLCFITTQLSKIYIWWVNR
nr:MAG TPA: hypothetical protein [Bacteriophage sp.]